MTPAISLIVLDVDGVITDGRVMVSSDGGERKTYDIRDVDAVFKARREEPLEFALLTGEAGVVVGSIAERFGITHVFRGHKDKLSGIKLVSESLNVPLSAICYVGDAIRDAPALEAVGVGIAPADALPEARGAADYVTSARGGSGCVSEAINHVISLNRGKSAPVRDIAVIPDLPSGISDEAARAEIARSAQESADAILSVSSELTDRVIEAAALISNSIKSGGKMLVFGNGGSAAEAQHFVGEFVGRFGFERGPLPAIALTTDTSILTALVNDYPPELVFARQVEALGKPGDVAVGMSTSGNSPNVVNALTKANETGLSTIGMTGASGGKMKGIATVSLPVGSSQTPRIQEAHGLLIHVLSSLVEQALR